MNERTDKVSWELGLLARAADARTRGGGLSSHIEAVGTDTRSLPPQSLFVALRGENFDGHAFLATAKEAGCIAAMVDDAGAETLGDDVNGLPLLVVNDTLKGYGDLAGWHRRMLARPVVAVTGSNGKTTVKQMIASVLGEAGTVLATGDFKMDQLPLDGRLTDLRAFSRLGEAGVDLFLVDEQIGIAGQPELVTTSGFHAGKQVAGMIVNNGR